MDGASANKVLTPGVNVDKAS